MFIAHDTVILVRKFYVERSHFRSVCIYFKLPLGSAIHKLYVPCSCPMLAIFARKRCLKIPMVLSYMMESSHADKASRAT